MSSLPLAKSKYIRAFVRTPLSRRDWVYLLSLLIPLSVYGIVLRVSTIISSLSCQACQKGWYEFLKDAVLHTIYLMDSEVFFNLGYAFFWIGLFALVKRAPLRWVVVVLFDVVTILVIVIDAS